MPYKNKEQQRECERRWYSKNREIVKRRVKERRQKVSQWLKDYKKNIECAVCGENHPACLIFHHKDENKEFDIGHWGQHCLSIGTLKKEIAKCTVLCANCHSKLHYQERIENIL